MSADELVSLYEGGDVDALLEAVVTMKLEASEPACPFAALMAYVGPGIPMKRLVVVNRPAAAAASSARLPV